MSRLTLRKIAKLAGVSLTTASDALNDNPKVAESTREKVKKIAHQYGYIPNDVARSLVTNKTLTLGVIVVNNWAPVYAGVVRGVEDATRRNGYSIFICNSDGYEDREESYADLLTSKQVDGIIIVSSSAQGMSDYFRSLNAKEKNFIVINRDICDPSIKSIFYDYEGGMYNVVDKIIKSGHDLIGYVGLVNAGRSVIEQRNGFKRALRDHKINEIKEYMFLEDYTYQKDYKVIGYRAAMHFFSLPQPPEAIVAENDYMAQGILQVARDRGIKVPEQLLLVGFGDYEIASLERPSLTSVKLPIYEAGVTAAEYLMGLTPKIEFPITLPCTVIERETLGSSFSQTGLY
jgi:LacI family transcriptional regulator